MKEAFIRLNAKNIKIREGKNMTEQKQIYKCNICGNIVEVLHVGAGQLVCCGQPMELLKEKTKDVGKEKHVPIIEKTETGIKGFATLRPNPALYVSLEGKRLP